MGKRVSLTLRTPSALLNSAFQIHQRRQGHSEFRASEFRTPNSEFKNSVKKIVSNQQYC